MVNCLEEMGVGGRDIWYDRGCRYEKSWEGGGGGGSIMEKKVVNMTIMVDIV